MTEAVPARRCTECGKPLPPLSKEVEELLATKYPYLLIWPRCVDCAVCWGR